MSGWCPIWPEAVRSSLWDEPDYVVKVFLTMLALKGADHVYRGTAYNLSGESRKTELEVLDALKILASPDTKRVEPQEYEGRRIAAVEGGWLILNGEKYRKKISEEMKRARNARAQAAWRQRRKRQLLKETAKERMERIHDEDVARYQKATEGNGEPAQEDPGWEPGI